MAADSWRKVLRSGATALDNMKTVVETVLIGKDQADGNGIDAGSVPRALHQPPPPNISVTSWPV